MQQYVAEVLYRPDSPAERFLPEGPMSMGDDQLSWVVIQHGPDATCGSIQTLSAAGDHAVFELPERPGFAFPAPDGKSFLVGLAGRVQRYDVASKSLEVLSDEVEAGVADTIVNDGMPIPEGVIFGTKDTQFKQPIAGLYLWRAGSTAVHTLRDQQTCSNGKDLYREDGQVYLLDIDTPTWQVVRYPINLATPEVGAPQVIVDLKSDQLYPDGMVLTPDKRSLIVALYNPNPGPDTPGEVRQYSLNGGELEAKWRLPGAPQVTCPNLVRWNGKVCLVATTAVENMDADQLRKHQNSGCLFLAETAFKDLP